MKQTYLFRILFIFLSWSVSLGISAQGKTLTGIVTDAKSGEPLPGVTIVIRGTQQGTITMNNGTYSLQTSLRPTGVQ